MQSWERNVLGIADWTDPRWKLAGLLSHLENGPDGAVVELGVYKGQSLLALALATDREVWGYYRWEGLPEASPMDFAWPRIWDGMSEEHRAAKLRYDMLCPGRWNDFADATRDEVSRKVYLLGVEGRVWLEEGWPEEPHLFGPERIAAASLDCDLYGSYQDALPWVWERLVPGGYVHLDEYYSLKYPGARIAVDEFLEEHGLKDCLRMHPRIEGEFERWHLVKPG